MHKLNISSILQLCMVTKRKKPHMHANFELDYEIMHDGSNINDHSNIKDWLVYTNFV